MQFPVGRSSWQDFSRNPSTVQNVDGDPAAADGYAGLLAIVVLRAVHAIYSFVTGGVAWALLIGHRISEVIQTAARVPQVNCDALSYPTGNATSEASVASDNKELDRTHGGDRFKISVQGLDPRVRHVGGRFHPKDPLKGMENLVDDVLAGVGCAARTGDLRPCRAKRPLRNPIENFLRDERGQDGDVGRMTAPDLLTRPRIEDFLKPIRLDRA